MDNVAFVDINRLFSKYELWNTPNELYWYENMWSILEKAKLTAFREEHERYHIILYAVCLMLIYSDFNENAKACCVKVDLRHWSVPAYKRSSHEKKRLCGNRKYGHVLCRLWRRAKEADGFAGAVGRAGHREGKGVDFSVAL